MSEAKSIMKYFVLLLVVTGALNTILLKLQNCTVLPNQLNFYHPIAQVVAMFLGQTLALFPFFLLLRRPGVSSLSKRGGRPEASIYTMLAPACLDLIASFLSYVALTILPSSIWQILKGGVILTTLYANRIIYGIRPSKNGYFGCLLAFLGVVLVGVVSALFKQSQSTDLLSILVGLLLVVASLVFTGIQYAYQQNLFKRFELSPLKLVGFEGLFGFFIASLCLVVIGGLGCPFNGQDQNKYCIKYQDKYRLDSFLAYFQDIGTSGALLAYCITQVFTMTVSVSVAVTVTKRIDATSRSLADITRTVLIWGFGIVATLTDLCSMQSLNLWANLLEVLGFAVMVVGVLTYHNIIVIFREPEQKQDFPQRTSYQVLP